MWQCQGSVLDAKKTKGVRGRLYRLADSHLGYYHPSIPAFDYTNDNLSILVVFESKDHALQFESELISLATVILPSPLRNLDVNSAVSPISLQSTGTRIFSRDYKSDDFESPPDTISVVSSAVTIYDPSSHIVTYQSIEHLRFLKKVTNYLRTAF